MRLTLIMFLVLAAGIAAAQKLSMAKEYNFGKISDKEKVATDITLRNSGRKTLKIKSVKPGCGCTTGVLEKDVLEPGETTVLAITFDPKGKMTTVRKSITFTSNDVVNPTQVMIIKADITPSWDFVPRRLTFTLTDGVYDLVSSEVKVTNSGDHVLKIYGIGVRDNNITIDGPSECELKPGQEQLYTISVDPAYQPEKSVTPRVVFKTDYNHRRTHRQVPVHLKVKTTVPVAPEPVAPEPVAPEPVASEPVAPEPVAPEPVDIGIEATAP
jgi:hypothetical protein